MAEVKSAYRKAAKGFHPDMQGPDASTAKFIQAQEAYDFMGRPHLININGFEYDFDNFDPTGTYSEAPRRAPDTFTHRFELDNKSSLTSELKPKLEAFAREFETLWAAGRSDAALEAFLAFQKAGNPLGREIFATLVGEKARPNRRAPERHLWPDFFPESAE